MKHNRLSFSAPFGEKAPQKARRHVFEGGPTYQRKPSNRMGMHTQRLYCERCGHLRTRCICP